MHKNVILRATLIVVIIVTLIAPAAAQEPPPPRTLPSLTPASSSESDLVVVDSGSQSSDKAAPIPTSSPVQSSAADALHTEPTLDVLASVANEHAARAAMKNYLNSYARRDDLDVPVLTEITLQGEYAYGVAQLKRGAAVKPDGRIVEDTAEEEELESNFLGIIAYKQNDDTWKVMIPNDDVAVTQEINLPVPFKAQVPPGDWPNTKNCGQTSSAMIFNYYGFYDHTPPNSGDITAVNSWLATTYNDPRYNNVNGWYTSVAQLANLARSYAGFGQSYDSQNWTVSQLKQEIEAGRPVVVAVYTDMDPTSKIAHFMVLRGLEMDASGSVTHVTVNDPGRSAGGNKTFDVATFVNSWARQNR